MLKELSFSRLVISSGISSFFYDDDIATVFRPYHFFTYFCPEPGEGHVLVLKPGERPRLYFYAPVDYWHETSKLRETFYRLEFDVVECASREQIWDALGEEESTAYIGPEHQLAEKAEFAVNDPALLARLAWERSFKTEYEIKCIERATRRAARGHIAAREAFFQGASELAIHMEYLKAVRVLEQDLPYPTIICLDEKSAILHYHKKRNKYHSGKTFLIDAGARYFGYGSDITRTYATHEAHPVFRELLSAMDTVQKQLTALVKPGLSFARLHQIAHTLIAQLLLDAKIIKGLSAEAAVGEGLSNVFFPHGLGHLLGILTHDVAGKQSDKTGTPIQPNPRFPFLRTGRILDASMVLTIEPGLYFIESLITPWRLGPMSQHFDFELISQLLPQGGIRIEDNILVTHSGHRNLTREYLA